MRLAVVLGYLLARASDTLADEGDLVLDERVALLEWFDGIVRLKRPIETTDSNNLLRLGEGVGLERIEVMVGELESLAGGEADLVREVVGTIISGQRWDLEWFGEGAELKAVASEEQLWDYTWRVAGCVGEFWTRLGGLTLGSGFSTESEEVLLRWGRRFGQGLQLVNILRDLPMDLQRGRCYLPIQVPQNQESLRAAHAHWRAECESLLADGLRYAAAMRSWRLRVAVELPARIGLETLALLGESFWQHPEKRVKVSRHRVKWLLARVAITALLAR